MARILKSIISLAIALSALLILPISCEKVLDPSERPSSVNPERTAEEEFWSVVGQLVGLDQRTDDYEGKTFKPTIGYPDNGDESVRIVAVNDPGAAVARYNELVSANISEETASQTYKSDEVGTITWTKSTDNKAWGVVELSVPSVLRP